MNVIVPPDCRYVATEKADYFIFICKCKAEIKVKKAGECKCPVCYRPYNVTFTISEIGQPRSEPLCYDRWYDTEDGDA